MLTENTNILVCVTADGLVKHTFPSKEKIFHTIQEKDNPIMCLDYSPDYNYFATAGNDKHVRLYDDKTKTLVSVMKPGGFEQPGHSNRIFSLCFSKENPSLLVSGGWDNTVQFYDTRQGTITNSFYGPHISGDSLDIKGDYILTGSWAIKEQIQLWDLRTMKLVQNVKWEDNKEDNSTYIYSAQFEKGGTFDSCLFAVSGSNDNTFRIFEKRNKECRSVYGSQTISSPCYSVDFSPNGKSFAYGCGDGVIRLLSIIR